MGIWKVISDAKDEINSFFNTRKTHIANGSYRTIWAMVDKDRKHVTNVTAQVEAVVSVSGN
jgi:hypothetical protein